MSANVLELLAKANLGRSQVLRATTSSIAVAKTVTCMRRQRHQDFSARPKKEYDEILPGDWHR
jgi:hypothetical protein